MRLVISFSEMCVEITRNGSEVLHFYRSFVFVRARLSERTRSPSREVRCFPVNNVLIEAVASGVQGGSHPGLSNRLSCLCLENPPLVESYLHCNAMFGNQIALINSLTEANKTELGGS